MHPYGTNQEFFAWTKGCGKMVTIFHSPFLTYSDGKFPAMRPLEVARELDSQGVEDD